MEQRIPVIPVLLLKMEAFFYEARSSRLLECRSIKERHVLNRQA